MRHKSIGEGGMQVDACNGLFCGGHAVPTRYPLHLIRK